MKNTGGIFYKKYEKGLASFSLTLESSDGKMGFNSHSILSFFLSFAGDPSNDRRGHLLLRWICLLVLSAVEFRFVHLFLNI